MAYIGNAPPPFITAVATDVFSANGTATAFTLSKAVTSTSDIQVVVDNIPQNPFSGSYSVSGATLTFSSVPASGSNNIVVGYRQATVALTSAAANSISSGSLQPNSVSSSSLQPNSVSSSSLQPNSVSSSSLQPNLSFTGNVQLSTVGTTLLNSSGNPILRQTGSVLQVVQTTKTDSFSTASTSYVTFMTVSITPTSATSKILVTFGTNGGTAGDVVHGYLAMFRGATQIFQADTAGNRRGATSVINTGTQQQLYFGGTFLDSPATTSAITYTIQVISSNGQTIYLNRSGRDTDLLAYDGRSVSSFTVMEIAA